jgi:putative two-component system response regulator
MARLREIDPQGTPILVLTAQMDRDTRLRALQGGAQDFITKPFDRFEVLARIHNQLEVRLLYQQVKVQNENLERLVSERTHELAESRLDIIRRLGLACEFRDNDTGMHLERMSRYSRILAVAAGLNNEHANLLFEASPMHDVGKIGVSDSILLKPGKLTPEEFVEIKKHATIGGYILASGKSDLLRMAEKIALFHHEKWDGTGYPQGLKGEEIPEEARIVAIADVFDALTSSRPYKKAWDVNEAADFILNNAGSHFDPRLAELFHSVLPEILKVRDQFVDLDIPDASGGGLSNHVGS